MRIPAFVVLAALWAGAPAVAAEAPPEFSTHERFRGSIGGPWLPAATEARLNAETLDLDCRTLGTDGTCSFRASYTFENPGAAPQELRGACYHLYTEDVQVQAEAATAAEALDAAAAAALDAVVLNAEGLQQLPYPIPADVDRHGFRLTVPAGASATLVLGGGVIAGYDQADPIDTPAIRTRHLVADRAVGGRRELVRGIEIRFAPRAQFEARHPVRVAIRPPAGYALKTRFVDPEAARRARPTKVPGRWQDGVADGAPLATFEAAAGVPPILEITFHRASRPAFHSGGPIVGLGGTLGAGPDGFSARLGYEVAYPAFVHYALSADSDFTSRLVVTPTVGVHSPIPNPPYWPSFDAGLGVPLRVAGGFDVGIRAFAGLSWGPVGFSAYLDVFPAQADAGGPLDGLLHIGLLALLML